MSKLTSWTQSGRTFKTRLTQRLGSSQARGAHRPTRKHFMAFCLALLLESVALQLITTAGDTQIIASADQQAPTTTASTASQTVADIQPSPQQPTPQPTVAPTPKPTSAFPQLVKPAVASAPVQPLVTPNLIYRYPLAHYTMTQRYSAYHQAIDLAAPSGTPIMSTAEGTVVETGYLIQGGGLMVRVDHGGGYNSLYAHLSVITSKPGQKVNNSVQIGRVGSTGWSTGPHLHFMITKNGQPLNPLSVLK